MRDTIVTERIGRTVYLFSQGHRTTAPALALRLGVTPRGARAMLQRLSRAIPIESDADGVWGMRRG